ncbi:MAG: fibronectin type III-like domain-contianing protein, partial [Prolixibacteraceae bacterium]|nr:fibronectin type III-like domain-contianing protein [Prolixibacteraceae bacterium]
KRLKGFKRVSIPRGQIKTVSIDIDCEDLWFWDAEKGMITYDKGRYVFEIGASSKDIKGTVEARMDGEYHPILTTVVAESDKVVLRPGNAIQTRVSACMSDDSFYDISKAKVTYKCNNPRVATVDANGKVTATGVGAALIIADVTIDGTSVSSSYPIKVMPDLSPKSITVNGKSIKGFDKEIKAYSYLLNSKTKIPVVKASAIDADIKVDVEQAKGVPGTAIVKMIDIITLETNTYYLNFDVQSVSDEFDKNKIGDQWEWIRENPSGYSMTQKPGSITITSDAGAVTESTNNAKNILLQSANADWVIETKLLASRVPSQPENSGILVYENDDNFLQLMFRAVTKTSRGGNRTAPETQPGTIDLVMEENGITKSMARFNLPDKIIGDSPLILKLEKKGSLYTAHYSFDGDQYVLLGTADILLKDIRAGLLVCDGIVTQYMKSTFWFNSDTTKPDTPFDVSFDYFRIVSHGLK